MRKRDTSVVGRDYVLHLANGERTLCGRNTKVVNCSDPSTLNCEGRCSVCLNIRARKRSPVTTLEFGVLNSVALRSDPWRDLRGSTSSRVVSQALGRLMRRGLVTYEGRANYELTEAGQAVLREAGAL